MNKTIRLSFYGLIHALLLCICSLLVVKQTCFDAVVISGDSMSPTLDNGDYGYCEKTQFALKNIKRFDIIIFEMDIDQDGKKEELIKRVIGLPNEVITFNNEGELLINNKKVNQNFSYNFSLISDETTVNENSYYVLGDNRTNSYDSRYLGCINFNDIKGVLKVITAYYDDVENLKGKHYIPFRYF